MVDIINRTIGTKRVEVQKYRSRQVSFNSWGHLAVRFFGQDTDKTAYQEDMLIVFDAETTNEIIQFVKGRHSGVEVPF